MSSGYRRNPRSAKARQRAQLDTGETNLMANRVAAVRAIAALDNKTPAAIVEAISAGQIPYVTLEGHEVPK